jgi:hypothetical protein
MGLVGRIMTAVYKKKEVRAEKTSRYKRKAHHLVDTGERNRSVTKTK